MRRNNNFRINLNFKRYDFSLLKNFNESSNYVSTLYKYFILSIYLK